MKNLIALFILSLGSLLFVSCEQCTNPNKPSTETAPSVTVPSDDMNGDHENHDMPKNSDQMQDDTAR